LEENNPWHDWMRKTRFGCFLVVFPEIACCVKEFLRNNGRFKPDGSEIVEDWFAVGTESPVPKLQGEVESVASSAETGVTALEQGTHVRWYESVRESIEGRFVLVIAQVESASGIEIDDLSAADVGADAGRAGQIFKCYKSHESSKEEKGVPIMRRKLPARYFLKCGRTASPKSFA
jgi:hypothetical protein